jgi:hypothetical protein
MGSARRRRRCSRAGLVERLLGIGLDLVDDGDLPLMLYRSRSPDRRQQNLDRVVTGSWVRPLTATDPSSWCRLASSRARAVSASGSSPP